MITIQNEHLTVTIAKRGAELQSIISSGVEYLWQGDPAYWGRRAPVLFPICGRLPENTYTLEGAAYQLPGHGFARETDFEVEKWSADAVTLVMRDTEATRAVYPFAFEFRVKYGLNGATLSVAYEVTNTDDKPLYMSFGGHEGYACPEGVDAYDLRFPRACTLDSYEVNAQTGFITNTTQRILENGAVLPLKNEHFAVDAMVFKHPELPSVQLRNRQTGRGLEIGMADAEYLLVWSKPGAPFVCIEPLWGIGCCDGGATDITLKEGIHAVPAGEPFARTHTITVLS